MTDTAFRASILVYARCIENKSVRLGNLFINDNSLFGALRDAETALKTFIGIYLISHVILRKFFYGQFASILHLKCHSGLGYPSSGHIAQFVLSLTSLGSSCRYDFSVCSSP
jgi:hypothetical protein